MKEAMMQKHISIAEAKNTLPSIVHYVEKGPYVKLTRRGKPVAVLLSIQEYEKLCGQYGGFWKALTSFRMNLLDEKTKITDKDFEDLRDTSNGRKVELS